MRGQPFARLESSQLTGKQELLECETTRGLCPVAYFRNEVPQAALAADALALAHGAVGRGQKKVVEALLKHGAAPSLDEANGFWYGSVLAATCNTYDQDHDTVRLLMKAGADPAKPEILHPQAKFLRKVTAVFRFFGVVDMGGFNRMLSALPQRWKQTPTHIAAARGDVALVKVLAEHEKFSVATKTTDTKGRTPLAVVVGDAPKAAIADIVGPVAEAVPGNKIAPEP